MLNFLMERGQSDPLKRGKIGKKRQKLERFFYFAPLDRQRTTSGQENVFSSGSMLYKDTTEEEEDRQSWLPHITGQELSSIHQAKM